MSEELMYKVLTHFDETNTDISLLVKHRYLVYDFKSDIRNYYTVIKPFTLKGSLILKEYKVGNHFCQRGSIG